MQWDGYGKLLVKYSTSLNPIASLVLPSPVYSDSRDLAVNAEGTVFIAGVETLSGPTYSQRLSVYDSNLALICQDVRDYVNGGYNDDGAYALALGANGHAFVAGAENRMFSVMEYDAQCRPQWSDASGNPSPLLWDLADRDIAYAVALDTQGNLLITGTSGLLDEFVILRENTTVLRYARNLPDLAFTAASGPTSANTCQQITVTGTLSNQGQDSTGTTPSVNLYLSSDATITTGDTYLGGITLNPMEPGTLQSFSITATIPTTTNSGAYYLGLLADPTFQIDESSETNNTRALPITITRVYPDLVVTSVSGPTSGRVGRQVTVTTTVKNQGACATGNSFMVDLRLSSNTTIDPADVLLSTFSAAGMNAGEQRTVSTPVTLRSAGTYYFGAIADSTNVIAESSETNNTRAGNRIKISK